MSLRRLLPLLLIGLFVIGSSAGALAQGNGPNSPAAPDALAGTGFTYQGELTNGSGPVSGACDFQFSLFNAASGGAQVGATQTVSAVSVSNGLFTVLLNNTAQFGPRAFDGSARWVAIAVRCPAGSGSFAPLSQRQPLTPAPLALALPGLRTEQNPDSPNVIGGFISNTVSAGAVAATIGGGGDATQLDRVLAGGDTIGGGISNTVGTQVLAAALAGPAGLTLFQLPPGHSRATRRGLAGPNVPSASQGGVAATVGGGGGNTASEDFSTIGGGDTNTASGDSSTVGGGKNNTASLGDDTVGGGTSNLADGPFATVAGGASNFAVNIFATIGGGVANTAGDTASVAGGDANNAGGAGAAIGGGGWDGTDEYGNVALGNASTIGGGLGNLVDISATYGTVGGGLANVANNAWATVGGGNSNTASGDTSAIGGGYSNTVSGETSAIGGGWQNIASGDYAIVGGGVNNIASGQSSTVPGGNDNSATMTNTLAAGHFAQANHSGTFVWADASSDSPFASSAPNQFLIRATGGVGIGTNQPVDVLDVSGSFNGVATPSTTVMLVENTASGGGGPDVLSLRDTNVLTPGTNANFITFFGSSITATLGAIQGDGAGGVQYAGPGNDFAEYLPKQSASDTLAPGDIVGVHAGQLSHQTAGADQVLVISTEPIVVGNAFGAGARDALALAALIGQAQVRVSGVVAAGDFILPSGQGDGVGLAVSPADLSAAQAAQIVGLALEGAPGAGQHSVRIAVGLPRDQVWASLMARQDSDLRARVSALEKQAALSAQPSPAAAAPAPQGLPGGALPWLLLAALGLLNLGGVAGYLLARQRSHA